MYKSVLPWRYENFVIANNPFIMIKLISDQLQKTKVKTVRLHSSGDFFNQIYIDTWKCIIEKFPEINFYAYTKVKNILNFTEIEKLSNFNLINSFVGPSENYLNFGPIEYCKDLRNKFDSFICPATMHNNIKCNLDCFYCVHNKNVVFVKH